MAREMCRFSLFFIHFYLDCFALSIVKIYYFFEWIGASRDKEFK